MAFGRPGDGKTVPGGPFFLRLVYNFYFFIAREYGILYN